MSENELWECISAEKKFTVNREKRIVHIRRIFAQHVSIGKYRSTLINIFAFVCFSKRDFSFFAIFSFPLSFQYSSSTERSSKDESMKKSLRIRLSPWKNSICTTKYNHEIIDFYFFQRIRNATLQEHVAILSYLLSIIAIRWWRICDSYSFLDFSQESRQPIINLSELESLLVHLFWW